MTYPKAVRLVIVGLLGVVWGCSMDLPGGSNGAASERTDLDLKEANVIEVEVEALGGGTYRFDVTLLHDDVGEAPDYADAWQVEGLQGTVFGRRVLLHSHGNEPFTRSGTIEIPAGVERVIVRGHDMQHGFGGQAMQVDLNTGRTTPVADHDD